MGNPGTLRKSILNKNNIKMKTTFYLYLFLLVSVFWTVTVTSCKEDKCGSQYCLNGGSCNSETGNCQCPQGYEGEHCETKVTNPGYVCQSGTCVQVADGAQYTSLSACQSACSPPPPQGGYNCVNGNCQSVSSGAQYSSLSACQAACSPPPPSGGCVGNITLSTCSGSLSDGSGTQLYASNLNCSWLISPSGAGSITLNFTSFDTESNYDFVRVYNGANASAPLIGTYSGSSNPGTVTANSGRMFVTFTTDGDTQGQGWTATYTCGSTPPPNQSGYNCINGNCQFVSSGAQFTSLSACQSLCNLPPPPSQSCIRLVNTTQTPMQITLNGITRTVSAGASTEYCGTPGAPANYTAQTSGVTNQGAQVGLLMSWGDNLFFPSSGTSSRNLVVTSEYFFLRIKNEGSGPLTNLIVNKGLTSQTTDNISIPNSGNFTNIGYYRAWTNSNVYASLPSGATVFWTYPGTMNIPFTENQVVNLLNTYFHESTYQVR